MMTFGACCSPDTAQFVKNKNAYRFGKEHPEEVVVIKKRHHVDDIVLSAGTVEEAAALVESVRFIHTPLSVKYGIGFQTRH